MKKWNANYIFLVTNLYKKTHTHTHIGVWGPLAISSVNPSHDQSGKSRVCYWKTPSPPWRGRNHEVHQISANLQNIIRHCVEPALVPYFRVRQLSLSPPCSYASTVLATYLTSSWIVYLPPPESLPASTAPSIEAPMDGSCSDSEETSSRLSNAAWDLWSEQSSLKPFLRI